jgi:ribosomal protein S18 acetylase RimI-like enzyme
MIDVVPMPDDRLAAWRPGLERRMVGRRLAAGVHEAQARQSVAYQLEQADRRRLLAWSVRRDGREIGSAATNARDDVRHLLDLDVSVHEAADAFGALCDVLRAGGGRRLVVDVLAADDVTAAALAGRDVPVEATQMQLDLSLAVAAPPRVELVPMTADEFDAYRGHLVTSYAQEMRDAGAHDDLDSALAASERSVRELLPEGTDSPGHHLWTAYDGDHPVAILWIHVDGPVGFIYDIEVHADRRRRGYGREVLDAGAHTTRALGAEVLGLNVFGPNAGARALYEKAGYVTTELTYRLPL